MENKATHRYMPFLIRDRFEDGNISFLWNRGRSLYNLLGYHFCLQYSLHMAHFFFLKLHLAMKTISKAKLIQITDSHRSQTTKLMQLLTRLFIEPIHINTKQKVSPPPLNKFSFCIKQVISYVALWRKY